MQRRIIEVRTKHPEILQITKDDSSYEGRENESRWYHYQAKDKYYPSVTWILDNYSKGKGYEYWMMNNTKAEIEKKREKAMKRGSKVHHAIYDLLNGQEVKYDDCYWNEFRKKEEPLTDKEWDSVIAFRDWFEEADIEVLESEMVTYSDKENYAGTVDCIAKIDGKVTVLDWKTGKGIYGNHWLQVAAYMRSLRENSKWNPKQTAILRVGTRHKNGYEPLKVKGWQESQKNFTRFKNHKFEWKIKNGYDIENPEYKPEFKEVPGSIKLSL